MIGLTSDANRAFVEKLGCYHDVVTYGEVGAMASSGAIFIDIARMTGDALSDDAQMGPGRNRGYALALHLKSAVHSESGQPCPYRPLPNGSRIYASNERPACCRLASLRGRRPLRLVGESPPP